MASKEDIVQINLMNWFSYQYPDLSDDIHHFANQRQLQPNDGREYAYAAKLKKMGVKRGVADVFLALPHNGYAGLWIELKEGKGKLSNEQQAFLERKTARGYVAVACWGFEAAKEVIQAYLKGYSSSK